MKCEEIFKICIYKYGNSNVVELLTPAALASDTNHKPATSDINFEITQKSDAVKALKRVT